jgi:hypothetical protein
MWLYKQVKPESQTWCANRESVFNFFLKIRWLAVYHRTKQVNKSTDSDFCHFWNGWWVFICSVCTPRYWTSTDFCSVQLQWDGGMKFHNLFPARSIYFFPIQWIVCLVFVHYVLLCECLF